MVKLFFIFTCNKTGCMEGRPVLQESFVQPVGNTGKKTAAPHSTRPLAHTGIKPLIYADAREHSRCAAEARQPAAATSARYYIK